MNQFGLYDSYDWIEFSSNLGECINLLKDVRNKIIDLRNMSCHCPPSKVATWNKQIDREITLIDNALINLRKCGPEINKQ